MPMDVQQYTRKQKIITSRQDLRLLIIQFWLTLILYTFSTIYFVIQFQWYEWKLLFACIIVTTLSWILPTKQMWLYKRIGKMNFIFISIFNTYMYYAFVFGPDASFKRFGGWKIFLILFSIFYLCIGFWIAKLLFYKKFSYAWKESKKIIKEKRIEKPIKQKSMRKFSIQLGFYLYLSIFVILIIFGILMLRYHNNQEQLYIMQSFLLNQCMFSAVIWSIPLLAFYYESNWSIYVLIIALVLESINLIANLQKIIFILTESIQIYSLQLLFLFFIVIRYIILFFCMKRS